MKKFKNDKKLALFVRYLYEKDYYIEGFSHQSLFLKNLKQLKSRTGAHAFVYHVKKKGNKNFPNIAGHIFIKTDMKKETNFLCPTGAIVNHNKQNIFYDMLEEVKFLDNIQYWG